MFNISDKKNGTIWHMFYPIVCLNVSVQVEEGWWEGLLNGKTGMFPSNFTKEILTESDTPSVDTPTSQDELRRSESQQIRSMENSDYCY